MVCGLLKDQQIVSGEDCCKKYIENHLIYRENCLNAKKRELEIENKFY